MKFILIANQRSGTGLLTSSLNSHPDINVLSEFKFISNQKKISCLKDPELQYNNPYIFYQNIKDNFSFNLKYNQINNPKIYKNCNIIHLIRKNNFHKSISQWINEHKNITNRTAYEYLGNDSIYNTKFKIPKKELIKYITKNKNNTKKWLDILNSNKGFYNVLTLYYEDLIDIKKSNNEITYLTQVTSEKICKFMNIGYQTFYTEQKKKLNPIDYQNYILNWNIIKDLEK